MDDVAAQQRDPPQAERSGSDGFDTQLAASPEEIILAAYEEPMTAHM